MLHSKRPSAGHRAVTGEGRERHLVTFLLDPRLYLTRWTSFGKIILHDELMTRNLPKCAPGSTGSREVTLGHLRAQPITSTEAHRKLFLFHFDYREEKVQVGARMCL